MELVLWHHVHNRSLSVCEQDENVESACKYLKLAATGPRACQPATERDAERHLVACPR